MPPNSCMSDLLGMGRERGTDGAAEAARQILKMGHVWLTPRAAASPAVARQADARAQEHGSGLERSVEGLGGIKHRGQTAFSQG